MNIKNKLRNLSSSVKGFFDEYITVPQPKPLKFLSGQKARRVSRFTAVILWILFPVFCLVSAEYITFITPGEPVFTSTNTQHVLRLFTEKPGVAVLDLIVLYTLSVVIAFIAKRLWVSCAVLGSVCFVLSAVSFFKFQNTGEYFYPWDLTQTGNVGLLTEYVNTDIPAELFIIGTIIILVTVFVLVTGVSVPIKWNIRIPCALITVFAVLVTYSSAEGAANLAAKHGMSLDSVYRGVENYSENGFVGALTLNILSESIKSPEEYSENTVKAILSGYEGKAAKDSFSSPNVIVILQESFWDIRQLPGCIFSADVLENYDRIVSKEGVFSGSLVSPTFGGGTVKPEFEVLTGLSSDYLPSGSIPYQYIEESFDCYPSMYKSLGYSTLAIHPYLSNFYTRDEKYPLLGFDRTLFTEELKEISEVELYTRGGFVSDDSFVNYIEYFIEETEEPLFLFGISMEGHQPYTDKFGEDELQISVTNPAFDGELCDTVTQYAQCLADADAALGELTEYVDSLDEDTILVVFGDHAPTLGNDKAAYRLSGFISEEGLTAEDMEKILKTPYLIYANFETEASTMLSENGENALSPYNLLNAALELCGAPETPMMQFLKDFYKACPVYNVKLTLELSPIAERFVKAHEFLSYDRIRGEGYSDNR